MRLRLIACSLLLTACAGQSSVSDRTSSSSTSSSARSSSSVAAVASSSVDPKAPKVYLQWQVKKLDEIIKGEPRLRLSLIVSGAARKLVTVGTFNGKEFDLKGTYVDVPEAFLKASIAWKGSGDEIWVEKDPSSATLLIRHRNTNEEKQYLSVERTLATAEIPDGVTVLVRP